jgi:hypothetical protein
MATIDVQQSDDLAFPQSLPEFLRSLLGIAGGIEAPTYADLYSGAWTHPTSRGCLR